MNPSGPARVIASAPSKVNLILRVGATDEQGYHALATVFEALSIREFVVADLSGEAGGELPSVRTLVYEEQVGEEPRLSSRLTRVFSELDPESHLAVRAARAMGGDSRVSLTVHKLVPIAGGMAGGSADCAATLVAVNELLGLGFDLSRLQAIGRTLGADVPACLVGGISLGTGRGDTMEVLHPGTVAPRPLSSWWVLVFSDRGLSTPRVFGALDELRERTVPTASSAAPTITQGQLNALREPDSPLELRDLLENELQDAALSIRPELRVIGEHLVAMGCLTWLVSGSGPTVAGLAPGKDAALRTARAVESQKPEGVRAVAVAWGPVPGAMIERTLPSWADSMPGRNLTD
ncbi:4-(cytidine 5'-diphospho)-2-C-methyl-D-erythritol kinase [Actinomycetaceae bacterium MB13-C1-2]|nr:4-(cytidine 5'-diphospho)-2-C-methyl-D-erythritol kinase [Actinomycetaceae bacterium MB13-C1-2]